VYLRYIRSTEPLVSSSPLSPASIASFPCGSQEQGVSSWRHGYLETNMDTLDQEELPVSETAVEEEEDLEEGGLHI
jgi:hypothetical protein